MPPSSKSSLLVPNSFMTYFLSGQDCMNNNNSNNNKDNNTSKNSSNNNSSIIPQGQQRIRKRQFGFNTNTNRTTSLMNGCVVMALVLSAVRSAVSASSSSSSSAAASLVSKTGSFGSSNHGIGRRSICSSWTIPGFLHGGTTLSLSSSTTTRTNASMTGFTATHPHPQPYPQSRSPPPSSSRLYSSLDSEDLSTLSDLALSGYQRPKVNWYPGHIAKAERQLSETLKSVDVVIEVRDARAPKATAHPSVGKWTAGRPRVVVLTRVDTVTARSRESWREAYEMLGADRWEERLGGEERNRNVQMRRERSKYDTEGEGGGDAAGDTGNGNYDGGVEEILFVDAKRGQGTHAISRAVYRAGRHVNERRKRRGLNERPLRVGIIGFPNVGKSALINKLLGRKRARTANTPGITRSLQWIRVAADKSATGVSGSGTSKREFELLDSPGIIPSDMLDQTDALLLAACNSVGVGAYDNQAVAAYLCDRIQSLVLMNDRETTAAPQWIAKCKERYGFDPVKPLSEQNIAARWGSDSTDGSAKTWLDFAATNQDRIPTGEDMLFIVADNTCKGDPENAARKILQDFRSGRMGPIALQLAPETESDDGQQYVQNLEQEGLSAISASISNPTDFSRMAEDQRKRQQNGIEERAKAAMEAAKEKGLDLPPVMDRIVNDEETNEKTNPTKPAESEVGKGLFDGW